MARAACAVSLIDRDRDHQGFAAAAQKGAANRRRAQRIEPDGDADMGIGRAKADRRIEADPAEIGHVGFDPGVRSVDGSGFAAAVTVAADIARRDPK